MFTNEWDYRCFECGNKIPAGQERWITDVGWNKKYPLCKNCDERMGFSPYINKDWKTQYEKM